MNEVPNTYSNLSDKIQFRSNKINEVRDYFIAKIWERELMSKRLSKYVAAFDYFDEALIVLPATSHGVSITSFDSITGAPVWIASEIFSFSFSLSTGIVKKLLKITRNKKKESYKIFMLARNLLKSIEKLIFQVLINWH